MFLKDHNNVTKTDPDRIKVLQVNAGYARRGAELHAINLALGLRESPRVQMSMVIFFDNEMAREARTLGLDVRLIEKRFRGDPSLVFRLARLIRSEGFRIVHTHLMNGNFYGRLAALMAGNCRVVSTIHNYKDALFTPHEWVKTIFYRQDILMGRMSDRIISVTDGLRTQMIKDGLPEDLIEVIPNSIDLDFYSPASTDRHAARKELGLDNSSFVVGTAGALAKEKRLDLFLDMAGEMLKAGIKARFVLVGEGYLEQELREQARRMGIEKAVVFTGYRSDLPMVLSAMDAFVLSSETETTSVVVVEAMAMGKPVVVMEAGDVAEAFTDGVSGYLVPAGDTGRMTKALIGLAQDPGKAETMGKAGMKEAREKYGRDEALKRVVNIYERVLQ